MTDVTETQDRQNPYQLVFGAESMDDRLFPPIAEEAEARDQRLDDPDRFLFLSSVGKLLQAIAEPGAPAGPEPSAAEGPEPGGAGTGDHRAATGADRMASETDTGSTGGTADDIVARPAAMAEEELPPTAAPDAEGPERDEPQRDSAAPRSSEAAGSTDESIKQYGRLLYHAFHYWRDRKPTRRVDEEGVRWLLDEVTSVGDWSLTVPASSGYLQLPRHLIWAEPAEGLTPEPVDGFFWRYTEPEGEPPKLHVLLVLGVRPDRAGFSVVPATGVLDDEAHWAALDARPDGTDFETNLPGGEMDQLYSIETPAEILKLASLCFWKLDPATG